jgi:hypothetical protein
MFKSFLWWVLEMFIGYLFFYTLIFSARNEVSIGWVSFFLVILVSAGVFASPLTRHLSFWNKVIDEIMRKEEEKTKF